MLTADISTSQIVSGKWLLNSVDGGGGERISVEEHLASFVTWKAETGASLLPPLSLFHPLARLGLPYLTFSLRIYFIFLGISSLLSSSYLNHT